MIKDVNNLISLALKEDIGSGDITSNTLIPANQKSTAFVIAKEAGVIAGLPLIKQIYQKISKGVKVTLKVKDGAKVKKGAVVAVIKGPTRAILTGERTVLNFLQRMSGVATLTNKFVKELKGTKTRILDTRKTVPGWRMLDKYAVKMGGGVNHRVGLFDAVLIKNNHLSSLRVKESNKSGKDIQSIARAVEMLYDSRKITNESIEIEVRTLNEFVTALLCLHYVINRTIIMLDNMPPDKIFQAVNIRNIIKSSVPEADPLRRVRPASGGKVLLEVSGGVNLDNIKKYAATGVDFISVGALTHSAQALDISLRIQ